MTAMLIRPTTTGVALAATLAQVDTVTPFHQIRFGWPQDRAGWTRCAEAGADFMAAWEDRIEPYAVASYGRSHPQTVSAYALSWYASVPGVVGGACFRQARRVPRLDRSSLAFRTHALEHYPDGIAVLDDRFWCLPGDPAAHDPEATVVPDEAGLAAVLRAQVRAHADDFLAHFEGRTRLPRRSRIGAFFDGLDVGVWFGGDGSVGAAAQVLRDTAMVLPASDPTFNEPSSVYQLTDVRGRAHLSKRRMGCCFYFRSSADGEACATCPRVSDAERAERYAQLD